MKEIYIINETTKDIENSDAVDQISDKPLVGLRWILVTIFFFTYFAMAFARNSCAVAIVVMVNSTKDKADMNLTSMCPLALNKSEEVADLSGYGEFNWSASQQGVILSTFFWGVMISKVFGSRFVEVIGQRLYGGIALAIGGILQLLSPLASELHPFALATVNFIQGSFYGPAASAIYSLLAVWGPSHELARMSSIVSAGGMFGVIAGVGIPGWLAEKTGWRSIFWLGAAISFCVMPFWIFFVRNSPKEHSWLSTHEEKILHSTKHIKIQKTVPWLQILKSPYLYICILGLFARSWGEVLVASGGPTFLSNMIGLTVSKAGLVNSVRSFSGLITMLIYGRIADFLVKRSHVKKKNARKIVHFIGSGGLSITLIAIAFAGCDYRLVVAFWVLNGIVSSGTAISYTISVIDFAPNYAGTVTGLCGLGNLGSALVPVVTAALVQQTNGWNSSFFLASGISAISCLFFVLFMIDEPQPWNFQDEEKDTR